MFERLTGCRCHERQDLHDDEARFLQGLDSLLESGQSLAGWVPRPPAMLPRLLACLRSEEPSLREAAALIRSDPLLVAEVVRLANAARVQHGAPVHDLERAVLRLGCDGLRRAASATVLRPLFDAARDPLLGHAAPRLWSLSEAKSRLCHELAPHAGVDPFDAYLAGLTHNVGWIGALRALGRHPLAAADPFSVGFVAGFARMSERMFGVSAEQWQLNQALSDLGRALRQHSLEETELPLARLLWQAERAVHHQVGVA